MFAVITCTVDPAYSDAFVQIIKSPILVLIGWMFWRATKSWRGREFVLKRDPYSNVILNWKTQAAVFGMSNFVSMMYFLGAFLALLFWLTSTFV